MSNKNYPGKESFTITLTDTAESQDTAEQIERSLDLSTNYFAHFSGC